MPNGINVLSAIAPLTSSYNGAGNFDITNLLKALQQGSDAANQASQQQYQSLLDTGKSTSKSILGKGGYFSQAGKALANTGIQGQNRINEAATQQLGSAKQDLINRGLYSTSALDAKQRAAALDKERATQELQSGLAGQKANLQVQQANAAQQLGGLNMDAILSKQNQGPDMGMYMSLIQQLLANHAAPQRSYSFSNMGSINSLNKPMTGTGASTFGGYSAPPPAPAQGGYYNAATMGGGNNNVSNDVQFSDTAMPSTFGAMPYYDTMGLRPGDQLFGGGY